MMMHLDDDEEDDEAEPMEDVTIVYIECQPADSRSRFVRTPPNLNHYSASLSRIGQLRGGLAVTDESERSSGLLPSRFLRPAFRRADRSTRLRRVAIRFVGYHRVATVYQRGVIRSRLYTSIDYHASVKSATETNVTMTDHYIEPGEVDVSRKRGLSITCACGEERVDEVVECTGPGCETPMVPYTFMPYPIIHHLACALRDAGTDELQTPFMCSACIDNDARSVKRARKTTTG
ncbi:hypothetical protein EXIGLDRAFT_694558 [Exidia glandulosa HHB12029]|uniref:Uncharacterized protein n=1 Tax=Exidia glandulosa HHB12029 TaxID=1314781 RepID=A0A166MAI5_EXIGL|nr:hypothetical protein EXIGLDRAFT_694558 [Exidia glandulosa HHB12029]